MSRTRDLFPILASGLPAQGRERPGWYAMSGSAAALTIALIMVGIWFSHQPLWPTDLWDHVNYGQYYVATGHLPDTEPLLELTGSQPMVHTAWASQLLMATVANIEQVGLVGLQFVYATGVLATVALIVVPVSWRSRSTAWGVVSGTLLIAVNWQQYPIIRPQLAGLVLYCFVLSALLLRVDTHTWGRRSLVCLFVLWANVHGSFATGLLLMGLIAIGRAVDIYSARRSLSDVIRHRPVRDLVVLTACCAAAVLINPNTWRIYPELFRVAGHPNMPSMFEWAPLSLQMKQGKTAAVATLLIIVACIGSRRRIRATEMLPLVAMAVLTIWSSRMINWFAPVAAWVIGIHGPATWRNWTGAQKPRSDTHRRLAWTTVAVTAMIAGGFCTPLGLTAVMGASRGPTHSLAAGTPAEAVELLSDIPTLPAGRAFLPAEWSGYISRYGPAEVRPIVNLHVHLIPPRVWQDYLQVIQAGPKWQAILNRYDVGVVVTDRHRHGALIEQLLACEGYRLVRQGHRAAVFTRIEPE